MTLNPPPVPLPVNEEGGQQGISSRKKLATGNWQLVTSLAALCVLAVMLLAFFLRFHNLGVQSLWNDEGNAYVQATRTFAEIADNAARDIHPPGYYWLLAAWRGLTGDSEFALRSLSAFASVLTVAFTYALGRRLFSPLAGLFAALFVCLNTFSIYYAQEARMYALLALWSVMGMWALARVLSPPPNSLLATQGGGKYLARSTLYLALINAAGLYTQYAYPFVMLAQGAVVLVWLTEKGLRTKDLGKSVRNLVLSPQSSVLLFFILANLLAILLYLPWLPTALHQVTSWPSTGQPIPAGEALEMIGGWFIWGITYQTTSAASWLRPQFIIFYAVFLVIGMGVYAVVRGVWRAAMPVLWVVVPLGLFLILGLFRPANLKFLLPSQIGFALFLGAGFSVLVTPLFIRQKYHWAVRLTGALFLVSPLMPLIETIPPLYTDPAYQRADYRGMAAQITADARAGDAIILDAPNQEEVFRYYYKGDAPVYPLPPGLGGDDGETRAAVEAIIARHDRIFVLFWGEAERDPNRVVETTLDQATFQAGVDVWYGEVRFARYETPADMPGLTASGAQFGEDISLNGYALSATEIQPEDVLQVQLQWTTEAGLSTAYKVFVQLLNSDGALVTQRDSEPGGGSQPTTVWKPGETVTDLHGLTIPPDLPAGEYTLIVGLYDRDDPSARLAVNGGDYLELAEVRINPDN